MGLVLVRLAPGRARAVVKERDVLNVSSFAVALLPPPLLAICSCA